VGSEELKKRRQAHDKYIDRQRVALATADLFTQYPEETARSFIAKLAPNAHVLLGDRQMLEAKDGSIIGRTGNSVQYETTNAPPEIIATFDKGARIAVGEVLHVNPLSGTVEVLIK
jgi:hypothetical protein